MRQAEPAWEPAPGFRRFKLTIEYDGRPFVGWQRQENGPSVQQALEEAAERLTKSPAKAPVRAHASGRTDAGVHGRGQVAHIDLDRDIKADKLRDALNFHLRPAPVAVVSAEEVGGDFHARFACVGRAYEYVIVNRRAPLTFETGLAWHVQRPLDAAAMHEAAQVLVGRHDFSSFRASLCQAKSPVKTLDVLSVRREGDRVLVYASARSFLHHQVRNMVGTLEMVGAGRSTTAQVAAVLAARDRAAAGPTCPPDGLYFMEARY